MSTARRQAKRALLAALRGTAFVAIAVKLLIPVGYMPAALADGSPIEICGFVPRALPAEARHGHHGHAAEPDGAGGAHARDDTAGHDHDDPAAGQHQWERCALGSLAAQAPLPADWQLSVAAACDALVADARSPVLGALNTVPFRSRAPPLARS